MIKFYLKKTFFDGLDNIAKLVVLNVLYSVVPVGLGYLSFILLGGNLALLIVAGLFILLLESFLSFGANAYFYKWSCSKEAGFSDFKLSYHGKFSHILFHWFLLTSTLFAIPYSQYFYLKTQSTYGLMVCILLVWVEIVFVLILQFYYPVCYYYKDSAIKAFKRSFSLVINNVGFSFFVLFRTIFDLVLTVFFGSVIPGFGGVCIARMDAVRMLCLKYSNEKTESWNNILADDMELLGKRTLKGTLFPWKENQS